MKLQNLLICILIISFVICPITVFAESKSEDIIITDLTEEEIEELMGNISMFGTATSTTIARWAKVYDNTKADVNGFTIPYYCPIYEGEIYKNYATYYTNNRERILFFPDSATFSNGGYGTVLTKGRCIEIAVYKSEIEKLKTYLFDDEQNASRLEVQATLHETNEGESYNILGANYSVTWKFNNSTHSDTYYAWYQAKYGEEPPLLNDDGTCAVHTYTIVSKPATCTEKGGNTYLCSLCGYSYFEETTEKLAHTYDANNTCTVCGEVKTSSGSSDIDYGDLTFLGKVNTVIQSKLNDNAMYNSLLYIVNTLSSLFTEDYTSAEGFYDLGIFSLSFNKPTLDYSANFGNDVVGDWEQTYTMQTGTIDWGLNNVQVLNLDWYFGKTIGYAGDGTPYKTKGVKATSDTIISGFMWLIFGWNVYIKMPDLISGDGGQIVSATSSANGYFNKRSKERNKNIEE